MSVVCPKCGKEAERMITKYGMRHACCDLWSWGGKPLTDASTHAARQSAHESFDAIWKEGRMTRTEAYGKLAKKLGISTKECHIALFDAEQCLKVNEFALAILRGEDESL